MSADDAHRRLEDLESRMEFQDDLLDKLNAVVTRQNLEILRLTESLRDLKAALREVATAVPGGPDNEVPPHY